MSNIITNFENNRTGTREHSYLTNDIKNVEMMVKYNPDNLFKNRRKVKDKEIERVAMIEVKSNNIFEKIRDWIKKILKIG